MRVHTAALAAPCGFYLRTYCPVKGVLFRSATPSRDTNFHSQILQFYERSGVSSRIMRSMAERSNGTSMYYFVNT